MFWVAFGRYQQAELPDSQWQIRPHYHTITHVKHVTVPVHVPIPAPPARVINHIVNVPIHEP